MTPRPGFWHPQDKSPPGDLDDLLALYRENYLHAIADARAQHDPATDWDAFRECLWAGLLRVFGV